MIKHYLKVAFRNLMKYKTQSLVSIIGLAVGFTCFALSVLWIRYEMTYDTFHKGAERIYMVRAHYTDIPEHISNSTPYPLAAYLQEKMPEIEAKATTSIHQNVKIRMENDEYEVVMAAADSAFMNFFHMLPAKNSRQNGIGSTSSRSSARTSGENTQRKPCKIPWISTVTPINT